MSYLIMFKSQASKFKNNKFLTNVKNGVKAVEASLEVASFLSAEEDPKATLAMLKTHFDSPKKAKNSESLSPDDVAICASRPSCASLGINQSLDDMLAVDQVKKLKKIFKRKKG